MKTRRFGTVLIVGGLLVLAYAAAVLFWRDPVTDLYNRYQQNKLESALEREFEAWDAGPPPAVADAGDGEEQEEAADRPRRPRRRATRAASCEGSSRAKPSGASTSRGSASRRSSSTAPAGARTFARTGHYERTTVPGLGKTVGIAGHRTTFGAPFRKIDKIKAGDEITLEMPYATFRYRVFQHEIVDEKDWSVIRSRGFDTLMLSACHPLYGSSERWIVYARLAAVQPREGEAYTLAAAG